MKILYIKLVNFSDVLAAMGKTEIEFDFSKIDKPIIQIYGRNRCGKTVLLQKLHPFSSINLNGDERNDLPQIIKGEVGIKNIVYTSNDNLYTITHTYKPTPNGHTVNCSLLENGVELNVGGGVNTFNAIIDRIFKINRYTFQFIINGTQLTSFANMNATQRKTLLNKAMGIDIYDKIHKLATEDYRYTSKLIASLNHTKEFLLSKYGSYETLHQTLEQTQNQYNSLLNTSKELKTRIDQLSGIIASLRDQNISMELLELNNKLVTYKNVIEQYGAVTPDMYDQIMEDQLRIKDELNKAENQIQLLMKDLDILYEKKSNIETDHMNNQRVISDYKNLISFRNNLENQIRNMIIEFDTDTPSGTFTNMMSIANMINDMCKEIRISLNDSHLQMFCDMILHDIDVSAFLVQEGSVLLDSEKEKNAIVRIRHMLNNVKGDFIDDNDCKYNNCLYKNWFNSFNEYVKSYENTTDGKFTQMDLEQFEHALKNYQTIQRVLKVEIPTELSYDFEIKSILTRIQNNQTGIDIEKIKNYAQNAIKVEQRKNLIKQLSDVEIRIKDIESIISTQTSVSVDAIPVINNQIEAIRTQITQHQQVVDNNKILLNQLDQKKMAVASIKNIDVNDLQTRSNKLTKQQNQLTAAEDEFNKLRDLYVQNESQVQIVSRQLEALIDADKQYVSTINEIDKHLNLDSIYKTISEATSSTKGKPVIAIRDKINEALTMSNRLLNVMYDGDIELLSPTIDETTFTLPFRCGMNKSIDIRTGSQSESTLLSLALSLSLASSLTPYHVYLIDEIDAYIDAGMRDVFVLMLQEMMATLKSEQTFLISHSIQPEQYSHIVHTIDITK